MAMIVNIVIVTLLTGLCAIAPAQPSAWNNGDDGKLTKKGERVVVIRSCYPGGAHCDVRIEPGPALRARGEELTSEAVEKIIEDVAPARERGKLIRSFNLETSRNGRLIDMYEHVVISRATTAWGLPEATIKFASVEWVENERGAR